MDTHSISTKFAGGMAFDADIHSHIIRMDASVEHGGMDSGASPKKMMLASLAGCTGIDIVSILNKMKVNFTDLRIDVQGTLTAAHPQTYDRVKINYYINLAEEDRSKMEKAVTLSEEKYCGVMAMFKKFASVETAIIYS